MWGVYDMGCFFRDAGKLVLEKYLPPVLRKDTSFYAIPTCFVRDMP
jgi:hypothetical protein